MEKVKPKQMDDAYGTFSKNNSQLSPSKPSLFRYATKGEHFLMIIGTITMLAGGVGMPAFSVIFGNLIDGIYDPDREKAGDIVQTMAYEFLVIGAALFVVVSIGISSWSVVAVQQTLKIRKRYINTILNQDVNWFESKGTQIVPTVLSDTNLIQEGLSDKFATSIQLLGQFISGMVIGFIRGWKLSLVILAVVPILAVTGFMLFKVIDSKNKSKPYDAAGAVAYEYISGIRTVQAFSLQARAEKQYYDSLIVARKKKLKDSFKSAVVIGFLGFGMFAAYSISMWYGSTLIVEKETNPETGNPWNGGDIVLVFFSVLIGGMGLGQSGPGFQSNSKARKIGKDVFEVIDRVPSIDVNSHGNQSVSLDSTIVFSDVDFEYPSAPDRKVLNKINLTIEPGQYVALVGPSGGGKSTVISLIERFYDATSGVISVGGVNIRDIDLAYLRSNIGLVSQEPLLFNMSIIDNIRVGKPGATPKEVEEAAVLANAHDFIMSLPDQYNTIVGDKGNQLSGGQKQRIAIARAVVRKPTILLLDEATSALDSTNEAVVQEALDRIMKGKTVVAIAHRLSTIKNAHKIYVIGEGTVQESGTHDELLSLGGIYTKLSSHQFMSRKEAHALSDLEDIGVTSSTSQKEKVLTSEKQIPEEKEEDIPKEVAKTNSKRLRAIMKSSWVILTFGFIVSIINGVLMPAFSFIFTEMLKTFYKCTVEPCPDDASQTCYGTYKSEEECFDALKKDSALYSVLFFVLAVLAFVCNFVSIYSFNVVAQNMTIKIRQMVFSSILSQDIGFFDDASNSTGALTGKLEGDAESINNVIAISSGLNIQSVTSLVAGLGIAFYYSWEMALILIGLVPVIMIAGIIQMKFLTGKGRENHSERETINQKIMESIALFRTITAFGAHGQVSDLINKELDSMAKPATKTAIGAGIAFGFSMFAMFAMYGCAFSLGAFLIRESKRSADEILKVFFGLACAAVGVGNTAGVAPDASKFKVASTGIFRIIDRVSLVDSNENGKKLQLTGDVNFESVSFAYPIRPAQSVVQSLSLAVPRYTKLAIVGPSGSGKSTIVRLLERFYDCTGGAIKLDGENIKDLNLNFFRGQIGLVEQEPTIFTGTVFDNIRMGKSDATSEEVTAAAKQANAHAFIEQLTNGYDTLLGTAHVQLSGGQKQRIAIARALIRNPPILLLDEATSALDSESEVLVNEVIKGSALGRTTITIAHRLSTIKEADLIIVMENGNIVESGTHQSLIEKKGLYATLVQQQRLGRTDQ